jgi:NAD(P)-dependent dehydrogenase (short-subunit alcohol dehydrogenase family)
MADLGFDGKVAIVTGAGGGLGRSHVLELARRGALVVVNDLGGSVDGTGSGTTAAQAVVDEVTAAGGEAVANYDSVATPEGGRAIVQTALDAFGRVDILVNNAGILRDASFKNMDAAKLEPVLDVHLKGAFFVTQPAWAHMRDQGYGRIVNTSSGAGVFGNFGQANYGAAKMGLVGLTRVLAIEGAKYGIKVNAIAPVAKTRMTEDILGPAADKMLPESITPVVAYLAHEDCPVSGEVYSVGGGRVARVFIGVTPGVVDPGLTVETVRDRFDEIRDETGYQVPASLNDEMMLALQALS